MGSAMKIKAILLTLFVLIVIPFMGNLNSDSVNFGRDRQVDNTVYLLAPVSAGQMLTIIHGYNDPLPNESCVIGTPPDHCQNQKYGLDLVPSDQTDKNILAPLSGIIQWEDDPTKIKYPCLGIRTDDNLNLNVCHFLSFSVQQSEQVKRGQILGTRSTDWIHLSLDDRYNISTPTLPYYEPIPFNGAHTIEGIPFDPGPDSVRGPSFSNTVITSHNVEEPTSSNPTSNSQGSTSGTPESNWWESLGQSIVNTWNNFWESIAKMITVHAQEPTATFPEFNNADTPSPTQNINPTSSINIIGTNPISTPTLGREGLNIDKQWWMSPTTIWLQKPDGYQPGYRSFQINLEFSNISSNVLPVQESTLPSSIDMRVNAQDNLGSLIPVQLKPNSGFFLQQGEIALIPPGFSFAMSLFGQIQNSTNEVFIKFASGAMSYDIHIDQSKMQDWATTYYTDISNSFTVRTISDNYKPTGFSQNLDSLAKVTLKSAEFITDENKWKFTVNIFNTSQKDLSLSDNFWVEVFSDYGFYNQVNPSEIIAISPNTDIDWPFSIETPSAANVGGGISSVKSMTLLMIISKRDKLDPLYYSDPFSYVIFRLSQ